MADDPSQDPVFSGLIARGYSPVQAAALAGNSAQESGGDPTAVNAKEDAHGLLQWRLDRWKGLQDFAKAKGTDPTDLGTQLDFIGHEINGPEAKAGSSFMAAGDLPSANAALKGYIRYGDNSDQVRLRNASGFLGSSPRPGTAGTSSAPAGILTQAQPASPAGPAGILNAPDDGIAAFRDRLAQLASQQQPQQAAPSLQPIPMAMPKGLTRARLLAALNQPLGG
jgi:hypothetical protein